MDSVNTFSDIGIGELRPGVTPRRWEPEEGIGKLNSRIHRESKYIDNNKKLPFSFGKPKKPMGGNSLIKCNNCGAITMGTTVTVGIICKSCNEFSTVTEVKYDI